MFRRFRHPHLISTVCLSIAAMAVAVSGCKVTSHASQPASLGKPTSTSRMEAIMEEPGPVRLEKVVAADWAVPLSGMLDLDDPKAEAAGLEDREEPIQIYLWALHHPKRGTYLVDSGVSRAVAAGESDKINPMIPLFLDTNAIEAHTSTGAWLERQEKDVSGVFLTHLHLDHIMGLEDIPASTPIYVGEGESRSSRFLNAFVQGTTDAFLEGHPTLGELDFQPDADGVFDGMLDVFGDESVFALHVPGHTAGSTAFVVRTTEGPALLAGDASHTCWGFAHGVPPGTFNEEPVRARASLAALRGLAQRHPTLQVHPGHQSFEEPSAKTVLADSP